MSIILSFGRYGGFYTVRGYMFRICLGWAALTIIPREIDDILDEWLQAREAEHGSA